MEERSNQPYPPDHTFIEYGSKAPSNFGAHNNSTRKAKRDRKKTKVCKNWRLEMCDLHLCNSTLLKLCFISCFIIFTSARA